MLFFILLFLLYPHEYYRTKIYYNYLTPEKLKSLLEQANIAIDDVKCVKDNDNASSYATGLMIFQATNEYSLTK